LTKQTENVISMLSITIQFITSKRLSYGWLKVIS